MTKVLFVGRLCEWKDPLLFIKAAKLLTYFSSEAEFIVAGDGILAAECKKLAASCENIHLLGWVSEKEVSKLMQEADIFCQLSPYENIWASTLVNALKHGKAIVCTDTKFTRKLLSDNVNCVFVASDASELARKLKVLIENKDYREFLGCNAKRFYDDNLEPKKIVAAFFKLLKVLFLPS
jgi:glycosyltransferase involved in cell wall biosynthesis